MNARPITMPACQIRMLLEGRMVQARRIIRAQGALDAIEALGPDAMVAPDHLGRLPVPIEPGERLWVREHWQIDGTGRPFYRATDDGSWPAERGKWINPNGMPMTLSRLTLHLSGTRIERLQDMTEGDAILDGARPYFDKDHPETMRGPNGTEHQMAPLRGPREGFERLWEKLYGRGAWKKNPWVQVIRFRVSRENIGTFERVA